MQLAGIPAKFPIPFGANAGGSNIRPIPVSSQIGIQAGAASLNDGFPPLNFLPLAAGGVPPFGADFNGILKQISQWSQWLQAGGGIVQYDSSFQSAIGGYPQNALVMSAVTLGLCWMSVVDNNLNNPDTGGAGWIQPWPATGEVMLRPTSEIIPGWVIANSTTIGNASSGASQLASATAQNLFVWHWNNFANSLCPVSGGRGATGLADFNANKTITVLDYRGTGFMGIDTMQGPASSRLSGVPVTFGATTLPGSIFGENIHQLVNGELPAITPSFTGTNQNWNLTGVNQNWSLTGTAQTWNTNQSVWQGNFVSCTAVSPCNFTSVFVSGGAFIGVASTTVTPNGYTNITPSGYTNITPAGSISGFGGNAPHNTVARAIGHTVYLKL